MNYPIKKGDRFICIKPVVMNYSGNQIKYHFNKEYKSDQDGCITNCDGNIDHMWNVNDRLGEFFHLLDQDKKQNLSIKEAIETELVINNAVGNQKSFLMP